MGPKEVSKKFRKKNGAVDGKKVELIWNDELEKWLLRVSIYDFVIEYIPGQKNTIADSLSRLPDENQPNLVPEENYLDNLVAIVEEDDEGDEEVDNLNNSFENNQIIALLYKQYDQLQLVEGILYRIYEDENGFYVTQFVLPAKSGHPLINHLHISILNAHLGRNKTTVKIKEGFVINSKNKKKQIEKGSLALSAKKKHSSKNRLKVHFQESALISDFKQNRDVRDAFGLVEALQFVPESDVPYAFVKIKEKFEQLSKLCDLF
ncbi:unnamed protein product [Brachionus calyciflorus]|uniref:Uncharacterized protein n=1 Tax=Brachionus calyciflorus TaxID=104777 RepID=A0A813PDT8_9BILA|nr:unnamed protein product [Brachionus calyciflorus]